MKTNSLSRVFLLLLALLTVAFSLPFLSFPASAATTVLPGDMNNDNVLSIQDVSLLLTSIAVGKKPIAGDTNNDRSVSIQDVTALLSYISKGEKPTVITIPKGVVDLTPEPLAPAEPIQDGTLPASGALKLKADFAASIPSTFFGYPTLVRNGEIALLIDGTSSAKGLKIDGTTAITYQIKTLQGSAVSSGTAYTDLANFPELNGDNGLLGISVPCDHQFSRFERLRINLSFTDQNGTAFTLNNAEIYYGLPYFGVTYHVLDFSSENISCLINKHLVTQTATINGVKFSLVINLSKWAGNTKPSQIATCAHLFWYCYPRMYFRFGRDVGSATSVTLAFENEGYEIASTGGSFVHIHDMWLHDNTNDYDCLTHEFAHVIQNGWDGNYCEYSGYIERFADYCRFVYAYNDGYYNDRDWEMQTASSERTLETSVRLLAWLDYNYSTPEIDIIDRWFHACYDRRYRSSNWDAAWAVITAGTPVAGKNGQELLQMFKADTRFAGLSTRTSKLGGVSPLNSSFHVREKLRDRLV